MFMMMTNLALEPSQAKLHETTRSLVLLADVHRNNILAGLRCHYHCKSAFLYDPSLLIKRGIEPTTRLQPDPRPSYFAGFLLPLSLHSTKMFFSSLLFYGFPGFGRHGEKPSLEAIILSILLRLLLSFF